MFSSERKIIGVTVPDVEQALTEQYGRSSLHERGRSQGTVSYLVRITSRKRALATILPNPNGITLRLSPYIGMILGAIYAVLILGGLLLFIFPGFIFAFFLFFTLWLTGTVLGRHIDNIVRGAEHQAKLRQQVTQAATFPPSLPPPLPNDRNA
jgi:predicted lipid-binding transport protein (Tim44 family)